MCEKLMTWKILYPFKAYVTNNYRECPESRRSCLQELCMSLKLAVRTSFFGYTTYRFPRGSRGTKGAKTSYTLRLIRLRDTAVLATFFETMTATAGGAFVPNFVILRLSRATKKLLPWFPFSRKELFLTRCF
jgi:hypothetical protein